MDEEKDREVFKPPRRPMGALQTMPTFPWMFSWPMRAEERSLLTNGIFHRNYPCPPKYHTSYPYRRHWQFRDHTTDSHFNPMFLDLRGGPSNIKNLTHYSPSPNPFPTLYADKNLEEENNARFEHLQLEKLDKRVWNKWMHRYAEKYFYVPPGSGFDE